MQFRVNFRDFPRMTPLYLDYLYQFDRVAPFYGSSLRPYELLSQPAVCAATTLGAYPDDRRNRIAAILERQNRHLGAGNDVFENIRKFRDERCCAIVTGQQVGLFGGPLFTVYKTLAAVRLAHELTARGMNMVPVFWINDIDHDIEEVNHCRVLNAEGQPVEILYETAPEFAGMPVGHIRMGPEIESTLQALEAALPATPHRDSLMREVRHSYLAGLNYSVGFSRLLLRLFRGQGLILMDPLDTEIETLASPVYRQAVVESCSLNQAFCARSRALEAAGYHAQVHTEPQATFLFLDQEGKRCALQRQDSFFHVKGTEINYSEEELLQIVDQEPWRLSPNVALRPVIQDFLLPTAAYIGGPSEVAYFAQTGPLYERFGRPMPVIFPRPSFTLLERSQVESIDRYQMELVDFLASEQEVIDRAFNRTIPEPIAARLIDVEKKVPGELEALREDLAALDPTLAEALDRAQQKVAHQLAALRTKIIHEEVRGHQDLAHEIRSCFSAMQPNGELQEREINLLSFTGRYGPDLIHRLYAETDLSCPDHRIVVID